MADLRTTYMGIDLANPIVVGASSFSKKVDVIKRIEEAGAGALVIKSLFEEQIQIERKQFDEGLDAHGNEFAEALSMFPQLEHGGPKEHLYWTEEARKAVKMPLIASLNAVEDATWAKWAKQLEGTGVDGLELNFYSPALDVDVTAADIEKREVDALASVIDAVDIPVSVKLHPHYTSLMNMARKLDDAGASGLVLFNRLFTPDIDVQAEQNVQRRVFSQPRDGLVAVRWTALLANRIGADVIGSGGISGGQDAARLLLAGAQAVQVVSSLYKEGVEHVGAIVDELGTWMDEHGHADLAAFRGELAQSERDDPWFYSRGQYIKGILGFD